MQTLRRAHLYLGCFFAPLLVFFALSGLWQMYALRKPPATDRSPVVALLSSVHTGRGLKQGNPSTLSTPIMLTLVAAMAVSLVANIVLGIVMAFRFGHRRAAWWCLFAGAAIPILCVILALRHAAHILPDL